MEKEEGCKMCAFLQEMLREAQMSIHRLTEAQSAAMSTVRASIRGERTGRTDPPVDEGMEAVCRMSEHEFAQELRCGRRFNTSGFRMLPMNLKKAYSRIKKQLIEEGAWGGKKTPPVQEKKSGPPVLDLSPGAKGRKGLQSWTDEKGCDHTGIEWTAGNGCVWFLFRDEAGKHRLLDMSRFRDPEFGEEDRYEVVHPWELKKHGPLGKEGEGI